MTPNETMGDKVERLMQEMAWPHERLNTHTWVCATAGKLVAELSVILSGEFMLISAAVPVRVSDESISAAAMALLELNAITLMAKTFVQERMVLAGTELRVADATPGLLTDTMSAVSICLDRATDQLMALEASGNAQPTGVPQPFLEAFNETAQ